jgi:hypothetical protein
MSRAQFHLGLAVIHPQLAVGHQPLAPVQPERLGFRPHRFRR